MGKILKVVGLVILAIVAAIVIYFMVDDVPSAKAKHYIKLFEVEEVDSLDNGYYYMKDFEFHENDDLEEYVGRDSILKMRSTTFDKMYEKLIRSDHNDYLTKVKTHSSYIDSLWKRYSYVNSIFENVCRAPKFKYDSEEQYNSISPFQEFLVLKNNYIALEYIRGNSDDAIKRISENLKDLRLHCKNVDTWSYKAGSAIYIERDLYLINNLLDYSGNTDDELINLIENLELLTPEERDHTNVARSDFYDLTHLDFELKESFMIPFYPKKNRIMNSMWFFYEKGIELSRSDTQNYIRIDIKEKNKEFRLPDRILWDFVFGLNIFQNVYNNIRGFHELNGYIQLLKLKAEIIKNEIAIEDIPEFLKRNQKKYYNPFNLEPLKWYDKKHEIYYEYPGYNYHYPDEAEGEIRFELRLRKINIIAR